MPQRLQRALARRSKSRFVALLKRKDARKMDPFIRYGMVAGIQAMGIQALR